MTIKVKYTKFELAIVDALRTASEPLTTRELWRRLDRARSSPLGISRTCAALEARGLIVGSKTLDNLESTWWHL